VSNSIYLVLDMENDLVHPDGPNGKAAYGEQARARRIVENTRRALDNARTAGLRVGFVRVGFSPDYRECPANSPIFSNARRNGIFKLGESTAREFRPMPSFKPRCARVTTAITRW
jgi:nicotinamidase-related amidase